MTTSADPNPLYRLTFPPVPTGTVTRFGTVCLGMKLRVDAAGNGLPVGYTVRKLVEVALVTVTFNTTEDTPPLGTPPAPVTWTSSVAPGPSGVRTPPVTLRVSRIRRGVSAR